MGYNWIPEGVNSKLALGIGVGVLSSAAGLAYLYKWKIENTPPKKWRKVGEISDIICYPIKSCGPIRTSKIQCNKMGLADGHLRDRVFMVTDTEGTFVSARTYPKLLLVQPRIERNKMYLSAPEMSNIEIDFYQLHSLPISTKQITVWNQIVHAVDCGDEVAKWFSRYLHGEDIGARLVFYPSNKTMRDCRLICPKAKRLNKSDSGSLHNLTNYMMLNEASVTDLSSRLDHEVTPLQFRPNFVVKGPKAYDEDDWMWIRVGEHLIFKNIKECGRCILTNINPVTGVRNAEFQPMKTMQEYRKIVPGESPVMGVQLGIHQMGEISLGDAVFVGYE